MMSDDVLEDPILGALGELRARDVGGARAHRLRMRCHAALRSQETRGSARPSRHTRPGKRLVMCGLAAGWCAVYLFETIRRAAAIYGL
jgi:hypothetical protein